MLERLGLGGVLVGAGVVTLLIGGLGLANAYLASVERRAPQLALLHAAGLQRREVSVLLLLEAACAGLLGSAAGLVGGLILSRLSWMAAGRYFGFTSPYQPEATALLTALAVGLLAALLFMGTTALASLQIEPALALRGQDRPYLLRSWRRKETAIYGTLYAVTLVVAAGLPALPTASLFSVGRVDGSARAAAHRGRMADHVAVRTSAGADVGDSVGVWRCKALARYPRHTAGLTLAMIAGAYAVGLAALATSNGAPIFSFPAWVAGGILVAGGGLVLTAAALAALERRQELALLVALGVRPSRVRQLTLLEYGIVAVCGGTLGASLALINWAWAGAGNWRSALLIAVVDVLATLIAAWAGAAPVLWHLGRRNPGRN